MSKLSDAMSLQDFFVDFTDYLHRTHTTMVDNWNNPLELTLNSFFRMSELANNAMENFINHQNGTIGLLFGNPMMHQTPDIETNVSVPSRQGTGKVALITGGIGGIGTEICKKLHDNGHQVIATYISIEAEKAAQWQQDRLVEGLDIELVECDVTCYDTCKKTCKQIEKQFSRIDILVNCAGITRDATLRKLQPENWRAVLNTNLNSVFNVTRNVIDGMIKRGYGRIINISSVNGQKGQFGQTNYSTAKAGIIGFSKALALEVADSGITVNTVCPGYVGTSMVEAIPDDIKNSIIAKIPAGRLAKPVEIAEAVAFLAQENSAYITGSEISINGGLFTGIA